MEMPYKGRASINDSLTFIEITIPAKRNWFLTTFMGVWLIGWLVGEFFAISVLAKNQVMQAGGLFMLVWLTGWTVGGYFIARVFLWKLAGREIIIIGQGQMSLDRKWLLFFRKKIFNLKEVRDIRVNDSFYLLNEDLRQYSFRSFKSDGTIKFDYGLQTIGFAADIDAAEAKYILKMLKEKHYVDEVNFDSFK